MAETGTPLNSSPIAASAAVQSAISGGSAVSNALSAASPIGGYLQAGAAALQAINGLANGGGPTGAPNVSTPNFNNGPTSIVSFGSGSINASANPVNTQSATTPTSGSNSPLSGIFGGLSNGVQYIVIGIVAIVAIKVFKKAA